MLLFCADFWRHMEYYNRLVSRCQEIGVPRWQPVLVFRGGSRYDHCNNENSVFLCYFYSFPCTETVVNVLSVC